MTEDEFRAASLRIMRDGVPSVDDNLIGMEMDFFIRLGDLDEIDADSVVVERTAHPERLIRASCKASSGVSIAAAIEAVHQTWLDDLRYAYVEANRVVMSANSATLDFVTQMGPGGIFVTGRVAVLPSA